MGAGALPETSASPPVGEKRHLAILFSDLSESTRLCEEIGAERFHRVVFEFLHRAAAEIRANGGYVARFMGDGLLAYFGYPASAEDDSVRAIRAALAIRTCVAELRRSSGIPLAVRSGVATGSVVLGDWLGDGAERERPVVGAAANLASRLQSAASPDTILVAESSYRLARSAFRFDQRADVVLRGIEGITAAYPVISFDRWEHRPWKSGPTPILVGRSAELAKLAEALAAVRDGQVRMLAIRGEAGIGKTALIDSFLPHLDGTDFKLLRGEANPFSTNTPFFLARQWFEREALGSADELGLRLAEDAELAAVKQPLAGECNGPVVLVAEDIHWSDPSSLEFIARLASQAEHALLLVVTSREPLPTALEECAFQMLELSPLDDHEMSELVRREVRHEFAPEAIERIVERADGIPLFGVELARHLTAEEGVPASALPWTLSELLAARLSEVRPAQKLGKSLAVLGLASEMSLLADLAEMTNAEAEASARVLHAIGAVQYEPFSEAGQIVFSHALMRDALYETLFDEDREVLHRRAATLLERRSGDQASFEDIARHWAAAGDEQKAAAAYAQAGEQHQMAHGYREAERAIGLGLKALERAGPWPLRDAVELSLQTTLASVLQIRLGYSAVPARAAASRARVLSERQGELRQKFTALTGEWMARSSAGEHAIAAKTARQLLTIAISIGAPDLLAAAWMAQVTSRFRLGDLRGAEDAFVAGTKHFLHAPFADRPGAIAQTYGNAALVAALLGDPATARSRASFAIRHSRRLRSDYDTCFATYMAAMLALMLGADRMAQRLGERALRLADKLAFPQFTAIARIVVGRARAGQGDSAIGIAVIRDGIAAMEATNSRVGLTLYLSWQAESELSAGNFVDAAVTIEQALTINRDELFFLPETLRLKGRILASTDGDAGRSDQCMLAACELAEQMGGQWFLQRLALTV